MVCLKNGGHFSCYQFYISKSVGGLAREKSRFLIGNLAEDCKKRMGADVLTCHTALEVALCYGWIDAQKKAFDAKWWLRKFTQRRAGSVWSKINKQKAERLISIGRMKPPCRRALEAAKRNGRWNSAYESQSTITVPKDLRTELRRNAKAEAFFERLNSANRYAILFRIKNAKKAQTRQKRILQFVQMLEAEKKAASLMPG
jgi:uncharacterized protein YdeI (YjbR/CyaY-like superfamily)